MKPFPPRRQDCALLFHVRTSFCSMRITEDVRKYAAEQGITEEAALERIETEGNGVTKAGSEIYAKA